MAEQNGVELNGFCDERFRPLEALLRSNRESGVDEGASLAVCLHGEPVVDLWGGYTDRRHTRFWERDTLVFVFSTSKVMVITATLMLWDRGLLDLDAPIATYWPEFAQNGKHNVTTRQVLLHRSGLPGFGRSIGFDEMHDWDRMIGVLEGAELWYEPGTISCYHPHTYGFLLGEVVHRISGLPFAQFFRTEIAEPLGADFHFGVTSPTDRARVSELWYPDDKPEPPNAMGARAFEEPELGPWVVPERMAAVIPSGNGLANARALARIGAMLAMGGELDGRRYLSRRAIEEAASEQSYAEDALLGWCRYGLGFGLHSEEFPAPTPTTFHWGGFGGSFITMDMQSGLSCGFTPNRLRNGNTALDEARFVELWQTIGRISDALTG